MSPRSLVASLAGAATLAWASGARAEPSAFFSGGGGIAVQRAETADVGTRSVASFTVGVGTTPAARFAVGGVFRVTTFFSQGTDLFLGPRLATGGFARGDFGFAVDLGVTYRTYGSYGRVPLQAVALFGVPFGFQVGFGVQALSLDGAGQAAGGMALLELDLLRLTVLRQGSSTRVWENPSPLGGAVREVSVGPTRAPAPR